jgi:DNA-binding Xre family transcriptional regulator
MKTKGVSTYKLREDYGFNTKTIAKLRKNENVTTYTLNKLCTILDCDISDIIQYKKDETQKN